jgi:sec-independent protein translocase protein TatB
MAREFQSGVDEIVREAELEDARKAVTSVSGRSVNQMLEKTIDPTGEMKKALNEDDLKKSMSVTAQPVTPVAPFGTSSTSTSTPSAGTPSIPVAAPAPTAPAPVVEPAAAPEAKPA